MRRPFLAAVGSRAAPTRQAHSRQAPHVDHQRLGERDQQQAQLIGRGTPRVRKAAQPLRATKRQSDRHVALLSLTFCVIFLESLTTFSWSLERFVRRSVVPDHRHPAEGVPVNRDTANGWEWKVCGHQQPSVLRKLSEEANSNAC